MTSVNTIKMAASVVGQTAHTLDMLSLDRIAVAEMDRRQIERLGEIRQHLIDAARDLDNLAADIEGRGRLEVTAIPGPLMQLGACSSHRRCNALCCVGKNDVKLLRPHR